MPSAWFASNGRPTETVLAYTRWLLSFLSKVDPKNVVACFDESLGSCFRNQIYPDYKCSRVLPDDDLAFQLLACKKVTQLLGISCYASDRFEADDLIASFAEMCCCEEIAYTVLSRDKDLLQVLHREDAGMWYFPVEKRMSKRELEQRFGCRAGQMPTFLALVGDPADDIPGVPGVGNKTAAGLLAIFDTWPDINANISTIETLNVRGARSLQQRLIDYADQIDMALRLTTLDSSALNVSWRETSRKGVDRLNFNDLMHGLGLAKLVSELHQ